MDELEQKRLARNRIAKIAFGVGALVCLTAGFIVYIFADALGLDPDTAKFVAIAFLVAGAADYIVLKMWDRLMMRR